MAELENQAEGAAETTLEDRNLLDKIVFEGKMVQEEAQAPYARDIVGELAEQVLEGTMVVGDDTMAMISQRIAEIDELMGRQLDAIMHAPEFQKLEGSWRGLHYLVMNSETSLKLKLRLFNVTRNELQRDLDKAVEFDQSQIFKKIYEEEYGTFGGEPYSVLMGDFEFGRHPQDVAFLEKISNVAAAAHAPFITAASPRLFGLDSFTDLGVPRDLAKQFESTELIKWRSFRTTDDARYVALTLPRILMRLPYGPDTIPVEEFNYVENVDGRDHSKYLWSNSAYALIQRITNAHAIYNWAGAIRGVEGGGLVEGLPTHTFRTDDGDIALKCPTEIAITDRRENELNELGFISLCHCKGTDYAAFFGGRTAQKPQVFDTDQANDNAQLSAILPYILASSRFAHYIKVIMRDKIGSFVSGAEIERHLNRWIGQYVNARDDASHSLKAKYPLRSARVDVLPIPGRPGYYNAVVFLRPHFQLEGLSASLRLVAELPPPAA